MKQIKCNRTTWGVRLACKFEPRYDKSEPILPNQTMQAERFVAEEWRRQTYVRDVCVNCGMTVERITKVNADSVPPATASTA